MSSNIEIQRICEYCRKIFIAKTTKTRYCSHTCNSRGYKAKVKGDKIETSNKETALITEVANISITAKDFLNIEETSKLLGISRSTLYRIVERGEIMTRKIGRRTIIRRSDVDNYFEMPNIIIPSNQLPSISDCYTINEMHEKFGISPTALYNLIRCERIPRFSKGKFTYVVKADIEKVLMKKII